MNPRSRLGSVLAGRLRALVKDLPSARQGHVEALHRTRVASRRMREMLPVLEANLPEARIRKTRRITRRITRALGRVRELDVSLALLARHHGADPSGRIALERLRAVIRQERDAVHREMLERLAELRPEKIVRKLEVGNDAQRTAFPRGWRPLLAARIRRRSARLQDAIDHAGSIYVSDRLHAVRVATKKLRYAVELVGDAKVAGTKTALRVLKQGQDTLGQLHDREVLIQFIEAVRVETGRSEVLADRQYASLVRELESECRSLHAQYLRRRDRLTELCAALAGPLARRVEGAGGAGVRTAT